MNKEPDTYEALIDRLTGGQRTYSLEEAMSYNQMQDSNREIAANRMEARRKAAASQRKAADIILNA
jgi:hypothetical protein